MKKDIDLFTSGSSEDENIIFRNVNGNPHTPIDKRTGKVAFDEDGDVEKPAFSSQEELDALLGEEFTGVKGQAAIDKLLKERRGHVKGAFHRDDVGDIDLFWGNDGAGLFHAIKQRLEERNGEVHARDMLTHLADTINHGVYSQKSERGDFTFVQADGNMLYFVIIAPEYHNNKITYMLTSYSRKIKKKEKTSNT